MACITDMEEVNTLILQSKSPHSLIFYLILQVRD